MIMFLVLDQAMMMCDIWAFLSVVYGPNSFGAKFNHDFNKIASEARINLKRSCC